MGKIILAAVIVGISVSAAPATPGVLVCHFNTPDLKAAVNDFGGTEPQVAGFRFGGPGSGCPVDPGGGALDAAYSSPSGGYTLPLRQDVNLGQGTLEFWVKLNWDFGLRAICNLVGIPLVGGHWNSISVCYHGLMSPTTQVFESNIMDGALDHSLGVQVGPGLLQWKRGEWHHIALTWTEHSQRFFGDGKLLGVATYKEPLNITPAVGRLYVGHSFTGMGEVAAAMIDELRLCTLPLYAGMNSIPVPTRPYPDALPPGLALAAEGATVTTDSEAPPLELETDVPELHDGAYGQEVRLGNMPATGDATVTLRSQETVRALVWSRDGRPFAGPGGQGWAKADSLPRDFVVETSLDGKQWHETARIEGYKIAPRELAKMTAARFQVPFAPTSARFVRLRLTGGTAAKLNQFPLLDELQALREDGAPADIEKVTTERTRSRRTFAAVNLIDGRIGEESLWQGATPGRGQVTVELPRPRTVGRVTWSRSREGLVTEGTPASVTVETSTDGKQFAQAGSLGGITGPTASEITFPPRQARWVRLTITATVDGKPPALDEIQLGAGGEAR